MSTEENKAIVRRLGEAINTGDFDALDEVLAPNYVRHDPTSLLHEADREQYKQTFTALRRAFPDAHWTLEEMLADGDRVIGRWTFRGTHEGPFFNLQPTGKEVTYPIIGIYRIADGMIVEDWHIFHALGLWEQLIPEIGALLAGARG